MPTDPADTTEEKEEVKETPKEEIKEEVVEKEITKEAPEEEPTKETTEETKEEETEVEFDVEEFKKSTVDEAQKAVLSKIAEGLGLTKKEQEEVKDELVSPWEKRGETKPKSWKEHAEYAADLAEWKREKREKDIAKVQEDNEVEAKEVNKKWNDYWDSELKDLVDAGDLPAITDEKDPKDQGRMVRVRLFAKMKEVGEDRKAKNLPPITSVELIFRKYKDEI